jgi:LL-diaminopimelate aminotransferase
VVDELYAQAKIQVNQQYPLGKGLKLFRDEVALWLKNRFNITMDPETEITATIGSKEAIANFPLAFLNPGDLALVPDPCYPPYKSGTMFAGGVIELMPLLKENNFFPDFSKISEASLKKAKLMFLNYPNNPTAACATREFYEQAVTLCKKYDIILCSDLAYSEMAYDGALPLSIFEIPGAKDIAIEFHSHSKTFNMTGWRLGFACGNAKLIGGLVKVKANIDSGVFRAIQYAGIKALQKGAQSIQDNIKVYEKRRDLLVEGLRSLGYKLSSPKATFYLWIEVPKPYTSAEFCMKVLKEAHMIVTPGNGFGDAGEGFFRIALTADTKRLPEVIERFRKVKL